MLFCDRVLLRLLRALRAAKAPGRVGDKGDLSFRISDGVELAREWLVSSRRAGGEGTAYVVVVVVVVLVVASAAIAALDRRVCDDEDMTHRKIFDPRFTPAPGKGQSVRFLKFGGLWSSGGSREPVFEPLVVPKQASRSATRGLRGRSIEAGT